MSQKLKKLVLVLILAAMAMIALFMLANGKMPPRALPSPNGYDDFLKAASMLTGDVNNSMTLGTAGLGQLLRTNAAALNSMRLGLTHACTVPFELALNNFSNAMNDLAKLKSVARLFVAEGRLAEMEDRLADAARSYAEEIQFGNKISQGGLLLHRLVGVACEGMGGALLANLAPKLNCEQARLVIAELEKVDQDRVKWDDVLVAEKIFARHQLRAIWNPINRVVAWRQAQPMKEKARIKHDSVIAHERLLIIELALRCYALEQGHPAERLEQLVPRYLQKVPADSFSGKTMIYRAQGQNWLLYSVGPDGEDNGGIPQPLPTGVGQGDLRLDSPWQ